MTDSEVYAGAVALGAIAGIRSMSGPALASSIVPPESMPIGPGALKALALGEFVADKLPFMPNRTSALPLIGRAVMGGISGAAICKARQRPIAAGAVLGAIAAVGMSFVAFKLRTRLSKSMPGFLVGLAEDALVAGAGSLIANGLSRRAIPA